MRFFGGLSLLVSSFSLFFNHLLFRCPRCLGVRPAWFSARLFDGRNGWAFLFLRAATASASGDCDNCLSRLPTIVLTVFLMLSFDFVVQR